MNTIPIRGTLHEQRKRQNVTILHIAAAEGIFATVARILCSNRSAIDDPTTYNLTALHYAVRGKHFDVVVLLVSYGSQAHTFKDYEGRTPLDYARDCGCEDIYQYLINTQRQSLLVK
jgi:ankyrin repeat protein